MQCCKSFVKFGARAQVVGQLWTPHFTRPFFTCTNSHACTRIGSILGPHSLIHAWSSRCCVFLWLLRHLHSLLLPHLLSDHPILPSARQLQLPRCGGQIPCAPPLRTLAPWPRTSLPQFMSATTTSSRRLMSNTPRSLRASSGPPMTSTTMTSPSARRSWTRAEDEPITLKKKACRPGLSSSVSHGKTVKPVVDRDKSHESGYEIQRQNSESEQIRILLERQREQILADLSSRDSKTRIPDRLRQKKYSQDKWNDRAAKKEEFCRAHQGAERLRQYHQVLHEQLLKQNCDLREAHEKSISEMLELKRFQGSTFDTIARRKLIEDRDTILELTGKIQELQNEINCMNGSRDLQDAESVRSGHSHVASQLVFPISSSSWWNAKPFSGNAEPQRRAAKHLGYAWYIGKRYCRSSSVFFSTLSAGVESMEFSYIGTHMTTCDEWEPNSTSGSEMSVRTVSLKFSRSSFLQIPHASNVRLLEVNIQDWGMYLLTIFNGSYALDQRSGDGWFSGWFKVFVIYTVYFIIPNSKERSVWRNRKPKKRTVSFAEDRSITWSTSTSGSLEPMILSKIMPTYLLWVFEMMVFRNSIRNGMEFYYQWRKSHLMTSWKDCTN